MANESIFQARLINELRDLFPEAIVLKNDPNYLQAFPDILILYENTWAALETKKAYNAPKRVNQEYYVDKLGKMAYASFIYPENKERILDELQQAFRSRR
jgi:hypothetical protein